MTQAFEIVRALGHRITLSMLGAASRLPRAVVTATLWAMSRTKMLRDLGVLGPAESRMLIEMMTAAAPGKTGALLAIRP